MNIFPLIAVGTCTTNLKGEILEARYELIRLKSDKTMRFREALSNPPPLYDESSSYDQLESLHHDVKDLNDNEIEEYIEKWMTAGGKFSLDKESIYPQRKKFLIHKVDNDETINDVKDAYLKLHLLSQKIAKPNSINLDGIFNALPNIAWTNHGPMDPDDVEILREDYDHLYIRSLDKFPCLTDYIIPHGVRIADASRVRLGAYLSEGTTVMHEGFVNFNAGTLGPTMIEGRISAGVVVGKNSDLGGGCSTMGTLSGGNDVKISVGEDCLLGANSGLGIPLGDRCIVEAGLYLTGGSKVEVLDQSNNLIETVKASELSLKPDLLFMRNSLSGSIQCKPNKKSVVLNDQLHSND
jgi:2,3,4,5-tetrahydropyridine-2,6-dicarboxylate N-succinyltransferase